MKRRILFVDDEPKVLQGLQRMLRSMRHEWDMEFASTGEEALARLDQTSFDVVVSDVRMPIMNGIQLITTVKQRSPQTVRILLSGQSDQEMILGAIGPAHQYLSKPCDANALKTTISRACALGELLENQRLKQVVTRIDSIPAVPSLYLELEREVNVPEPSIEKAAAIISQDVGMTAQILKLVNSAFFGTHQHMSDPLQAVLFLGLDTLKTLVLGIQIFHQSIDHAIPGFSYDRLWSHSVRTGDYARKIVQVEHGERRMVEEAFAGGLLHDVGVLLLASQLPDQYEKTLTLATSQRISLEEAELSVFGATHAEIGAYLLGLWGLGTSIVESVAFHHSPSKSLATSFVPLIAVHVANVLAAETSQAIREEEEPHIDREFLDHIGLLDRVAEWRQLAESEETIHT